MGQVATAPLAAVGGPGQVLRVFWRHQNGSLWTTSLAARGGWSRPARIG
jgi:hypothetical protein